MTISTQDVLNLKTILDEHSRQEKHIGYHILPERFNRFLSGSGHENKYIFSERERFNFFKQQVDFKQRKVIDIGCNIGYFLFSILDAGAANVTGYEGKKSCGEFITQALAIADDKEKFHFFNQYYQFGKEAAKYDIGLLLNVIHHTGDDYRSDETDIEKAKENMLSQLNQLSGQVETLIFQMGFNWKGNRNLCLFANGTKREMIDFIEKGTVGYWDVAAIGIAEKSDESINYQPLSESNIARVDALGEFLNRPLFILKSKNYQTSI